MVGKLRSGTTLIVDRYSYSGVAFSSAKGLDIEWCKAPEIGLLAPDLVVYLDISPEKAADRGGYGGERYEQLEFQKKVARSYLALRDSSWKVHFSHPFVYGNRNGCLLEVYNYSDNTIGGNSTFWVDVIFPINFFKKNQI